MAGDEREQEVQVHWLENVKANQFIWIICFIHDVRQKTLSIDGI